MNVEPSPKYMNGELNSQIGIRGQDSHFSEVKWDFPYIHASYGVLHYQKYINVMHYERLCTQVLAAAAKCGTAHLLYQQDRE
jgi:hypothetical protein